MNEAKEKLSRADSSSSDSEDEGITKRKKVESADKPTEEVCSAFTLFDFTLLKFDYSDGGENGRKT